MTPPSATPRTDALLDKWPLTMDTQGDADKMQAMVSHARQLERELADRATPKPAQEEPVALEQRLLDAADKADALADLLKAHGVSDIGDQNVCREAASQLAGMRKELADMTADYLRRHKDACDRWLRIQELEAALAKRAGYVLVPVEPTTVMVNVGADAFLSARDTTKTNEFEDARDIYKAMLAAAPDAGQGG
jgi:hypothetical protein